MTWLHDEGLALKTKLANLKVVDANAPVGGRPVQTYFRMPEYEVRDHSYPNIIVEYTDVKKASDREHRGATTLPYQPAQFDRNLRSVINPQTGQPVDYDPGVSAPSLSPFKVKDWPIPYDIDFSVVVEARIQNHLLQIVDALALIDYLPARFGYLEIASDDTVRSLELLVGPEFGARSDADGKRIFQAAYSVRVPTELNLYGVQEITTGIVTSVHITEELI